MPRSYVPQASEDYYDVDPATAYGNRLRPLTVELAKALVGSQVLGLVGQNFWEATSTRWTKARRMKQVEYFSIDGSEDDDRFFMRSWQQGQTIAQSYDFEAYEYHGNVVTGSGADPMFVFV